MDSIPHPYGPGLTFRASETFRYFTTYDAFCRVSMSVRAPEVKARGLPGTGPRQTLRQP